jgi:ferredoxin
MSNLKKISIDGIEVEVDGAMTIIQAAEVAGVEIPRFCYHERLTIAGNCRMCLVEVVGGPPKPAASCAMQVRAMAEATAARSALVAPPLTSPLAKASTANAVKEGDIGSQDAGPLQSPMAAVASRWFKSLCCSPASPGLEHTRSGHVLSKRCKPASAAHRLL